MSTIVSSSKMDTGAQEWPSMPLMSVGGAIDTLGFGRFQVWLTFLTGLCFLADAMEMMLLSILSASLVCSMSISSVEQAMLTTIVFFGMWLSSTLWGHLADQHGRRRVLLLSGSLVAIFGLLTSFSINFHMLLALRFLVGLAIGAIPQVCTLYAEYLPSNSRAKAILLMSLAWAIGATLLAVLALIIMPNFGWRMLVAVSNAPILLFVLLGLKLLPESALFMAVKGDHQGVHTQLKQIAQWNGSPPLPPDCIDLGQTNTMNDENVSSVQNEERWADLFNDNRLRLTVSVSLLWLVSGLSYYGVVLLSTELLRLEGTRGGGCEEKDSIHSLDQCRELSTEDYIDLVWTTVAEFPGTLVALLLIDWLGRRVTMATMASLFSLTMILTALNVCKPEYTLITMFTGRAAATGLFQSVWVYTPEVFPTRLRAVAMGTCSSMARVGAMLTPFVAQVLLTVSPMTALLVYFILGLLAAIVALRLPIETKGQDLAAADNITNYNTFGIKENEGKEWKVPKNADKSVRLK